MRYFNQNIHDTYQSHENDWHTSNYNWLVFFIEFKCVECLFWAELIKKKERIRTQFAVNICETKQQW
jgi:hypothetical protein